MRIKLSRPPRLSRAARYEKWRSARIQWHTKFIWWPIRIDDHLVFLETVLRRGTRHQRTKHWGAIPYIEITWTWEYKLYGSSIRLA